MKDKFDKLCEVSVINLYTLSKDTHEIHLKDFSFKKKDHRVLLHGAQIIKSLYGFKIFVNCDFREFLKEKIFRKLPKGVRYSKKEEGIDIENFLLHISDAYELEYDIWNDVYDYIKGEK